MCTLGAITAQSIYRKAFHCKSHACQACTLKLVEQTPQTMAFFFLPFISKPPYTSCIKECRPYTAQQWHSQSKRALMLSGGMPQLKRNKRMLPSGLTGALKINSSMNTISLCCSHCIGRKAANHFC